MIVRTEAVILKRMDFRETSRILTLYTREFGKQDVLAKGVRGPKSKMKGTLEPLSYVQTVFYKKVNRDLHLLSQCDLIRPWKRLSDDLERMAAAMGMVELVLGVTHGEERNPEQFTLLVSCLDAVNESVRHAVNLLYLFEVRLLGILGFRPEFQRCSRCGVVLEAGPHVARGVDAIQGGVVCSMCAGPGEGLRKLSQGALQVLRRLQDLPEILPVTNLALSSQLREEVGSALRLYLRSHVEGLKDSKSEAVFASIR
jgi:DNA repair protein RecO (recombination protein O)